MSQTHLRADREHDADRHPGLTPLVIDLIPDQTRAELEESIDAPLVVERFERRRDRDRETEDSHTIVAGNVGRGRTPATNGEFRAELREDSASDTGGSYYE